MAHEHEWFYEIFQLDNNESNSLYQFASIRELEKYNLSVDVNRYNGVYCGFVDREGDVSSTLNELFVKFNVCIPEGFVGHSLSVSDVIVLRNGT